MLSFILILGAAYGVVLLFFRVFEYHLIFFPDDPGRLSGDWKPKSLPVEDVSLETQDRVNLHAWWIPSAGAQFTFIAFHGNAANVPARIDIYRFLHALPVNVLAVEYRGYGRSKGSPTEAGLYRDAQAAYDYLTRERGIIPGRIISYGQSLGTAVAVDLATQRPVAGVVLEAPFPSARAVARQAYPFLPGVGWIARSKFETGRRITRLEAPVLIVHCSHDPVLAFPLGQEVYARAREPKILWRVEGKCHEEASLVAPEEYGVRLRAFLGGIEKNGKIHPASTDP